MTDRTFDLVVIGTGPGGYVAAIRAAQLGLKTAVVEKNRLGGICLNWGCIPTKALLRSAEVYHMIGHASDYGIKANGAEPDLAAIVKRSRAVADRLNQGVVHLLKKNKVTVIEGEAKLLAPGRIKVTGKGEGEYGATHIVLATGARPRVLPGLEPDKKLIWTYFEAMVPESLPKSLLVVGSGAIGIEFASFYADLGSKVTVVEMLPQILPVEDEEIAAFARKRLEKKGITFITSATVEAVKKSGGGLTATVADDKGTKSEIAAERMISAAGVVGNVENLGLEALGVKTERGTIVADGFGRTNVPGIYAIGDVAGPPMLAHKAEHEGVVCVEKIAGVEGVHPIDKAKIPGCTYCSPQIASVGLTEKKAKEAGYKLHVGRFPFMGNGKAIALGEDQGLVKTIFDEATGQLLGAHMVGAEVTELIQGFVVAMNLETTEEDLMHAIFPHPTLSEMMHESTLDAFGRAIHI